MANKTKKAKKTRPSPRKKAKKRRVTFEPFVKIILSLLILLLLIFSAGWLLRYLLLKPHPPDSQVSGRIQLPSAIQKPTFEIYPQTVPPAVKRKQPVQAPLSAKMPKIAIIVDDTGYDLDIVRKFIDLDVPLTLSILPQSPFQNSTIRLARNAGYDIMLHLPMEPNEYPGVNPGPGTLLTSMTADERLRLLKKNLDELPQIKGVNNHMGSKMTANADQMRQIFTVLKQRGLFFVDSRTTAQSICRQSAQLLQVPFEERDVFIDHQHDMAFIENQMNELARIARSHGEAIGIAHPHRSTLRVLQKMIPEMKKSLTFVPVAELVKPVG